MSGGKKTKEEVSSGICEINKEQSELYKKEVKINVVMPYVDRLSLLNEWYRQIWAESLGKNGYGTTPVNAMGTVDQHSQLQIWVDGPKDKFYTFIVRDNKKDSLKIEKTY